MNGLSKEVLDLSPDQRALLMLRLKKKAAAGSLQSFQSPIHKPAANDQSLPLSFAQQRLWFLDQLEPDSPFYNIPAVLRLEGLLSVDALTRTINEIVRRHDVLRTSFHTVRGDPVQRIAPFITIAIPVTDLSHLGPAEREAEVKKSVMAEAQKLFDLKQAPLVRVTLLRLAEEEHVVLFTMHHIVSDGWSLGVLVEEVVALYRAYSEGTESPLAELPVQYADYAIWQREQLQGIVLDKQLSYWRNQLGDAAMLELPTDHPRPAVQSYRGAHQTVELSSELTGQLKELSQREGVTLFMTLLAAFQTLLSRYSGQDDIVVGTAIANRNRTETEQLIGFFVNALALRTDLSGSPTFVELLGRVREVTLGAYAHQDVPFEKLVGELHPERSASRTPIFQVAFVLQNAPLGTLKVPGLSISPMLNQGGTAKFDLTLYLTEEADGLNGTLEYNTDLFEVSSIAGMAERFRVLLESIVAQPEQQLSNLGMLMEGEERKILVEWNDTQEDYPRNLCIHQLFESQVEVTPDAVALADEGRQITYRELNTRSNQLAHYLQDLGVGPDVIVGICIERSIEMAVGLLGILKAGAAYLPLDPHYPVERLAFMVEDAQVPVLLTSQQWAGLIPAPTTNIVCVDSDSDAISRQLGENLDSGATAEDVAYVIYTSGSTGRPKGVLGLHRGAVNRFSWMWKTYPFQSGEICCQKTSLSFLDSLWEIFGPMLQGVKTVIIPDETVKDPSRLIKSLSANQVTRLVLVPSLLRALLDAAPDLQARLPKLNYCVTSGEALSQELFERFQKCMPVCTLLNLYGSSEVSADATWHDTGKSNQLSCVPIGRPIANTRIYLLDPHFKPVPVGVPGELFISGDGLARGYLKQPELTDERFFADPFSDHQAARLFRTGDRARYLPDGTIEYLGRKDYQVKIRGYRIELSEVESVMTAHPAVCESVVIAREDLPGERRLVAYVVSEQGTEPSTSELHRFVKERLPEFMIPSAFVFLGKLPLTPSGKIDRKALPAPDETRPDLDETFVAPRTHMEEVLAGIWCRVLGLETVGVFDNFFELGGHSLMATRLISEIREAFNVDISVRKIFETSTVGALAEMIDLLIREDQIVQVPPVTRVPRNRDLPLSFAQQRLWFLDQLEPGSSFYNVPAAVRLQGQLDATALEGAINGVVRRHEVLRTSFQVVDGEPVQVIAPNTTLVLKTHDVTGLEDAERQAEVRRLITEEGQCPFDLKQAPLLRVTLLRLAEAEHVALFTMHHIISDGWSLSVLVDEVAALYTAYSLGEESPLPELPVQYADYSVWQREHLQGAVLEKQLSYWKRCLGGQLPVLALPTDHPRPAVQSYRGAKQWFALSRELTQQLKELSQREGVTLFMTLLAAFQTLLSRCSGQNDIVVGTVIANRTRLETEKLIGFFVNTLALRTDLSGGQTFLELLRRVREVTLGAYAHQDVPFEKLVEELQPERSASRTPIFQVAFGLQNAAQGSPQIPNLTLTPLLSENETARFDLTLWLEEFEGKLYANWTRSTELFNESTIIRMEGYFETLLHSIVVRPEARLRTLDMVTEGEKQQRSKDEQDWEEANAKKLMAVKRQAISVGT